jgi:hypothetical protein
VGARHGHPGDTEHRTWHVRYSVAGVEGFIQDVTMKKAMLAVLQKCWEEESVPPSWKEFYMTVLPKKGDLSKAGNWRGTSIRESFAKLYTIILKKCLNELYETIAPDYSNGFRQGRGRSD